MIAPSQEYRRLQVRVPPKVHEGLDSLAWSCLGAGKRCTPHTRKLLAEANTIDGWSPRWKALSESALRNNLFSLREHALRRRGLAPNRQAEALGMIREAAFRTIGLHPYVVQMAGALALHRGMLCEMATGEGKTLTAALAAIMAGWSGLPCHVITVNDYLAERDARWFAKLYEFCGVSVGHVLSPMPPEERLRQYSCDVTYTTSKEVVADFLRDRLRLGRVAEPERRLLSDLVRPASAQNRPPLISRAPCHAIVDEADSVLIDEAVTPLIICQPHENEDLVRAVQTAATLAGKMEEGSDFRTDRRYKEVELLSAGSKKIHGSLVALPALWKGLSRRRELLEMALTARIFYQRGHQYVVQDGKIVIIDESTGRLMPNRTWREGLHQAIEAKEGLEITHPSEILARLSFQRYFRLYRKLSGMTGTARESSQEFWKVYGLTVVSIPPNRPCQRKQWPTRYFATQEAKWSAVVAEVRDVHATGRPVLAGTRSVEASETLARLLGEAGLRCHVLNAERHAEEASIVAQAGETGRITIATNMAGRGTDILLGHGVGKLGGLHVVATEPNESARIDRQLFGRAGRQGNPGSARAFVSLEDQLLVRFVPGVLRQQARLWLKCPDLGMSRICASILVNYARGTAHRLSTVQRQNVLRTDKWLDESLAFAGKGNHS